MATNELYHHGIKGQKWGVRRYQNEDGSYTSLGKERRNLGKELQAKIQKKYDLSDSDAEEEIKRRINNAKRIALIAAGVALTAAGIYAYQKYGRNYVDEIISSGTTIQTIHKDENRMLSGEAFYTAYTESDKIKYVGLLGHEKWNPNKITAVADKDIKIASTKTAKKVFDEMLSDKEFRSSFYNNSYKGMKKQHPLMSDYEIFNNFYERDSNESSQKIVNKFHEELKKRGYGGVHDVNDRNDMTFYSKAVIIFDRSNFKKNLDGTMKTSVSKLSSSEIKLAKKYAKKHEVFNRITNPIFVATASAIGSAIALKLDSIKSKKRMEAKYIENYKKEHPNSKLKDSEILNFIDS